MIQPTATFDFDGYPVRLLPSPFLGPDLPWVCLEDLCFACLLTDDAAIHLRESFKARNSKCVVPRSVGAGRQVLSVPYLTAQAILAHVTDTTDVDEHKAHCEALGQKLTVASNNVFAMTLKAEAEPAERFDWMIAAAREARSPVDLGGGGGTEMPADDEQPAEPKLSLVRVA